MPAPAPQYSCDMLPASPPFFLPFLGSSMEWMLGSTPPSEMVTPASSLLRKREWWAGQGRAGQGCLQGCPRHGRGARSC